MAGQTCGCGKPAGDAYVCPTCADTLTRSLADTTNYLTAELHTALAKQHRFSTGQGVKTTGEQPLPYNHAASEALSGLHRTLWKWVRICVRDHVDTRSPTNRPPHPATATGDLAQWLRWRIDGLTRHPDGNAAVTCISTAATAALRIIDRPPDKWFAGPCDQCGADVYARTNAATAKCPQCRTEYDVAERRRWLLAAAEDHNATASEIARALVVWSDYSQGENRMVDRIRKWETRQRIWPKGHITIHGRQRALYRLGDVLDLLGDELNDAKT